MKQRLIPSLALLLACGSSTLWAADAKPQEQTAPAVPPPPTLEQRVTHVEQILKSQSLLDMLARIDALQQDNRQLRGELEEQSHRNDELQQRLDDLYRDLNRRISQLERVTSATGGQNGATATGDATAQASQAEQDAYQKAFELLRDLRYDQAADAFTAFLKQYPKSSYAHNAQYWLAEAYYARNDYAHAISEYQTLGQRFPDSPKLPETLLKIGYCYNELGKPDEAKKSFEDLLNRFPQSPEAQQAQESLKTMGPAAKADKSP